MSAVVVSAGRRPPAIVPTALVRVAIMSKSRRAKPKRAEIPVIGDVDDWEADVVKALLDLPPGSECVFYIDSVGGSVYGALAVLTLLRHRNLEATAIVIGECSSAALLLFAACRRRLVTPFSVLLFHRMRWQSDKRVDSAEAYHWAKHFEAIEKDLDGLQLRLFGKADEQVRTWIEGGHYVTGTQMVEAGLAEMLEL
jgi:ATP-dependent protease ClpP protease subunit